MRWGKVEIFTKAVDLILGVTDSGVPTDLESTLRVTHRVSRIRESSLTGWRKSKWQHE